MKYILIDKSDKQIIEEFETRKEAEIFCEEKGIDYDFFEIIEKLESDKVAENDDDFSKFDN